MEVIIIIIIIIINVVVVVVKGLYTGYQLNLGFHYCETLPDFFVYIRRSGIIWLSFPSLSR